MNELWFSSLLNQKQEIFDQYRSHPGPGPGPSSSPRPSQRAGDESQRPEEEEQTQEAGDPHSRYSTEFKELAMVGWGGGGEVWMAMNHLDGRIYAVKKISLSSQDLQLNKKIRREVTTISGLLHAHVVRYYASWVEEVSSLHSSPRAQEEELWSESTSQHRAPPSSSSSSGSEESSDHLHYQPDHSSFDFVFEDSATGEDAQLISQDHELSSTTEDQADQPPSSYKILYIQMEYCHATLQEAIADGQICHNPLAIFRLFRQLLEAMKYIHSTRVIHRDMKVSYSYCSLTE
jgi:eukaryotic translation initiation factor 2-alpha kinase 4